MNKSLSYSLSNIGVGIVNAYKLDNINSISINEKKLIEVALLSKVNIKNLNINDRNYIKSLIKLFEINLNSIEQIQKAKEKYHTPDSKYRFFEQNPDCATYSSLEKVLRNICTKFNIIYTVNVNEIPDCITNITYEITHNTIKDCVLSILSITQHIQKCNYTINVDIDQCKMNYELLITNNKGCNLSFNDYNSLLKKGYTSFALQTIYGNNASLTTDGLKLNTVLHTYDLGSELCFDNINLTGTGNPKLFLEQALEEVNIDNNLKKEIINSHVE